jgi:hypothetical protein
MALDSYVTSMYLTRYPSFALDPYVTSMYPTGHPSMALDSYVTSMYLTGHSSMGLDPSMYPIGHPSMDLDSFALEGNNKIQLNLYIRRRKCAASWHQGIPSSFFRLRPRAKKPVSLP